jgi:hypothetical protein
MNCGFFSVSKKLSDWPQPDTRLHFPAASELEAAMPAHDVESMRQHDLEGLNWSRLSEQNLRVDVKFSQMLLSHDSDGLANVYTIVSEQVI